MDFSVKMCNHRNILHDTNALRNRYLHTSPYSSCMNLSDGVLLSLWWLYIKPSPGHSWKRLEIERLLLCVTIRTRMRNGNSSYIWALAIYLSRILIFWRVNHCQWNENQIVLKWFFRPHVEHFLMRLNDSNMCPWLIIFMAFPSFMTVFGVYQV